MVGGNVVTDVRPDAVLFDVDDTLCRYRRSGAALLAAAFDRTGQEPFITVDEYHDRYPEFVDDSDSMRDLRAQCFAAIAARLAALPLAHSEASLRSASRLACRRSRWSRLPLARSAASLRSAAGRASGRREARPGRHERSECRRMCERRPEGAVSKGAPRSERGATATREQGAERPTTREPRGRPEGGLGLSERRSREPGGATSGSAAG